jgi:orotate phosphoribosyltransferase
MHEAEFIKYSRTPFTLKSGIKSNVYVYGREDLTDNPNLEWLVGEKLCDVLVSNATPTDQQVCLIGIPTAGTPFAQAAAMASVANPATSLSHRQPNGKPICHRIMKEVPKDHGAHKGWINGEPKLAHSYWLVDNVATNGASKPEAREKMRADGYPDPAGIVIWIDRQQGAVRRLAEAGFNRVLVAYQLLDVTYAFGEMEFWPKSAVTAVQDEIEAHQFLPSV